MVEADHADDPDSHLSGESCRHIHGDAPGVLTKAPFSRDQSCRTVLPFDASHRFGMDLPAPRRVHIERHEMYAV